MKLTDLDELIKTRRSIRVWLDKDVSEKLLMQAVELATWAPNAGNQQNWHFYVIVSRDTIKDIADAVQAYADQFGSWPETKVLGDFAIGFQQRASFFRTAPAAIAVAASQYQSPVDKVLAEREKTDPQARQIRQWRATANSGIQSVSSAIAYLLLILHQMGLGAVWMTGPLQAKGEIEKILKVPSGMDIVAFLPVGYPAENPTPKERRPIAQVAEVVRGKKFL
jgi:nitroreductase